MPQTKHSLTGVLVQSSTSKSAFSSYQDQGRPLLCLLKKLRGSTVCFHCPHTELCLAVFKVAFPLYYRTSLVRLHMWSIFFEWWSKNIWSCKLITFCRHKYEAVFERQGCYSCSISINEKINKRKDNLQNRISKHHPSMNFRP